MRLVQRARGTLLPYSIHHLVYGIWCFCVEVCTSGGWAGWAGYGQVGGWGYNRLKGLLLRLLVDLDAAWLGGWVGNRLVWPATTAHVPTKAIGRPTRSQGDLSLSPSTCDPSLGSAKVGRGF